MTLRKFTVSSLILVPSDPSYYIDYHHDHDYKHINEDDERGCDEIE